VVSRCLPARVAAAFGVEREVVALAGTEGRTYRSGNVILRQGHRGSAARWALPLLADLPARGFRVERPLRAHTGAWIVQGWTAWTALEGHAATPADAPVVAAATQALHEALAAVPYAPHLTAAAGFADRAAWGEDALPAALPHPVERAVRQLVLLRRPVVGLRPQVIHGDLNHHNILIAPGHAPGFIDFSPYWRPAGFASAIEAYWLGPYRGETAVLSHFRHIRELEQMLVRVALRQLLRLVQMDDLTWAEEFVEAATRVQEVLR
jgi:uncharacterized protein (TIGR02569 family)